MDGITYGVKISIKDPVTSEKKDTALSYTFYKKKALVSFLESFGLVNVRKTLKDTGVFSESNLPHVFSTYSDCKEYVQGTPIALISVNPIRPDDILELCPTYGVKLIESYRAKAEKQIPVESFLKEW